MKILTAAYYEFIKNMRDIKILICLLIFPTLITYILGNAVGNFFNEDTLNRIAVGYINSDKGVIGKEFDSFIRNEEIQKRLNITAFDNKNDAEAAVNNGTVDAVIYVPENLSESIQNGTAAAIQVDGKKNTGPVESITNGFISSYNSISAVMASGGKPSIPENDSSIKRVYYTKDSKMPRMIDYYSVLELLNVLILGAIFGVAITSRSDSLDMKIRINSLPVSRFTLVFGRILGSSVFLFGVSIFAMLFTKFVYNADWNGNMLVILGTMFVFSLICVGIGVLIGIFIPNLSTALMVIILLMMFFGTVSGAISPAYADSFLRMLSPNYHAKTIIFGTIYGYPPGIMMKSALYLAGFITVIYGVSAAFIGRKKYGDI